MKITSFTVDPFQILWCVGLLILTVLDQIPWWTGIMMFLGTIKFPIIWKF